MDRRARVLLLTPDFPPARGGIQLLMGRLVTHWRGVQTLVVTRRDPRRRGRREIAELNLRAVVEAIRFRPDVVLSAHVAVSPAAWVIRRVLSVPYAQYVYGQEIADRPRLAGFAVRHAAAVIPISDYATALVRPWVNEGHLRQIPPGVDFPVRRGIERSAEPLIVTVSRLAERYKGHDVMLRSLPLVRARIPNVRWVVVGEGPLRPTYERMADALGVKDHVRFIGSVDDDDRDRWLDSAQLYAMPSRLSATGGGEGFGIAYLEAGAHALPVVAGNVAGARDAVVDGVTGLLVDPTDHLAVADAITELLTDRGRADALGRAGELRARQFAWPRVAERVEDLLQEVAAGQAA
jgi:phosphatidylinositol alpha-1,6-mannosyltransferase